ncbi:uncharacterized protein LOC9313815 [Arabidopsis lyrata subsp. lyrata]|uniref:uncharacterized protein LOC9313815 n=1 Tax=Arabidopsis lyrata subsp. lyrata TaxID=81972 RepID=UPI000A29D9DC|nr:uncharacterized protein LOC9313815 [Arabidopsis lyrata subsp. lyrata]|eukprot:XP_020880698.1 uncharacterized protein LOC9313815 [Arabidopsis lyrata subsp. lyrata]
MSLLPARVNSRRCKMATGNLASRLHLLIDRCVRQYPEREANSPTKETEKDLLLSLSQVLREIQSGEETVVDHDETADALYGPESKEYLCLERLVADIVGLLGMKNVHIKHLAGNILVEVSESLVQSGSQWDEFIRLLCECLRLAVIYSCPIPAVASETGFGIPDLRFLGSDVLKCKLEKASWSTVSDIFRILRNILKRLSQEEDEELLDVYLESVNSTLAKVPWSRVDTVFSHQHGSGERNFQGQSGTLGSTANSEEATVFLGNFVQFLCSMVQHVRVVEDSDDSEPSHLILQKTIKLVPDLIRWCQPKLKSQSGSCMSRYLGHKLLVLMIRLTDKSNIKCTILLSWLQYLQRDSQGFLQHTLTKFKPVQDNCLEGSPFFVSLSDREINETHSNHLQRLSVFLFLRCSFTLIYSSRHNGKQCEFDCRKKGMAEMFKWIVRQIPGIICSDHRIYSKKSVEFSASFVRLFMHEDDLLFKVLLQLLSVPLHRQELPNVEGGSLEDEEQITLFRFSTLFNPVTLFCIFLSELHYDHQVLLDYLISKDIGDSCAEYLLRCLRAVCDSWTLFVEFPFEGSTNASSPKRRKVLPETSEVEQNWRLHPQAFEDAKDCLLSLQNSVVKLHQKKLFPYNPEALLRRLSRFQELCLSHE